MASLAKVNSLISLYNTPIVPVFYHSDLEVCKEVIQACYAGGIRFFEFTNRGSFAHELFSEIRKWAKHSLPELSIGAGTIMDAGTASVFLQSGADFIVSPVFIQEVAQLCNKRKTLYMPGCATLSEISKAEEWGCEVVKLFPAFALGPQFVKAAMGPMPKTNLMPTGGVEPTQESIEEWFKAGVFCVGIGSQLFTEKMIAQQEWHTIAELSKNCLSWAKRK